MRTLIAVSALVVLLSAGFTPDCQAGVGLHRVSSTGIAARIVPAAGESGTYNIYMGALWQGSWYLRQGTGNNWPLYTGGPYPVAGTITLTPGVAVDVPVADFDISSLVGLDVYVAYGRNDVDVWVPGHLERIYRVPGVVDGVLRYSDITYAVWTAAYPFKVTRTGVTRVENKTNVAGQAPFFNCLMGYPALPDGRILTDCQNSATLVRSNLYINPLDNGMYNYSGAVPANIVWLDAEPFDPATPNWGPKARISGGWYFADGNEGAILYFQEDGSLPVVIKSGTWMVEGNISRVVGYNN